MSFTDPNAAFSSIDQAFASFRAQGTALASHYEVLIFPPNAAFSQSAAKNVSLRCESISMPGMNLNTSVDANMYGVQPAIVDGVSFSGTTNMVFPMSQDLRERKFFEQWQGLAWNKSTWNIGYYSDYIGTVEIYMLDNNFNKKFGIKLFECYPKEINGNDLTATPATTAMKLTVQMQYKYWDTLDTEREPSETGAQDRARVQGRGESDEAHAKDLPQNTPATVRSAAWQAEVERSRVEQLDE